MPWLRAVTAKIAYATASVHWRLYGVKRQNGRFYRARDTQTCFDFFERQKRLNAHAEVGELVEVRDHPALRLLHDVNPYHTGLSARKLLQSYLDLTGEFFILFERDTSFGHPIGFWPLPSDWIKETPTTRNPFYVVGLGPYQYNIPMTEIIWATDPDPANPYGRGSSLSGTLGDELDTLEFASKTLKSHFLNRGRPDFVAFVKPKRGEDEVSNAQLRRLQQRWLEEHQGFYRAFKPHFINRELDIHEFSQDFRRQQLIPIMEFERNTIVQVYGFPPEVFGILESSNRATIAAADYFFARYAVLPRLEFQREVFQKRLMPEYDDRLILDFDSPIKEDEEFQLKVAQAAPWSLTRDDFLELMGKPKPDDGEGHLRVIPNNMIVVDSLSDLVGEESHAAPFA
jgi:hypothetical protein